MKAQPGAKESKSKGAPKFRQAASDSLIYDVEPAQPGVQKLDPGS